ncbi:FeoB-associated Cys-rich membrane protein [Leptotrichia sp. OH3620_COT-345]|nr:FeoB-associated Cys-rich membrane protein [Leptotrichia sp. OH3620_COT-345]RRD37942.1 FeoB-associated Cys-rich membrane protein [Leptotrichia sp. OH3620_COT-345]
MESLSTLIVFLIIVAISILAIKKIRKSGGCSCGEKSCKSFSRCNKQWKK